MDVNTRQGLNWITRGLAPLAVFLGAWGGLTMTDAFGADPRADLLSGVRLDTLPAEARAHINRAYLDPKTGACAQGASGELVAQCNRLRRYNEIEEQFKKCGQPTSVAELTRFQQFKQNVLMGAGTLPAADIRNICAQFEAGAVGDQARRLQSVPRAIASQQLVAIAAQNALVNSARAFHGASQAFPGGGDQEKFLSYARDSYARDSAGLSVRRQTKGPEGSPEFRSLCVTANCKGVGAELLRQELAKLSAQSSPTRMSEAAVVEQINSSLARVNTELKKVRAEREGKVFSSPNLSTAQDAYDAYLNTYLQEQQILAAGPLMSTGQFESAARVRLISDLDKGGRAMTYSLPEHPKVELKAGAVTWMNTSPAPGSQSPMYKVSNVEAATLELKANIALQAGLLSEMVERNAKSPAGAEQDLARLVKTNPLAVGQALMSNPEFTPFLCSAFGDIAAREESDKGWRTVAMVGGAVGITAAAVLSGGLALAGAPAIMTAIAGGVATVGGVALGGYQIAGAVANNNEAQEGLRAFQAGSNSGEAQLDAQRAYSELKSELVTSGAMMVGVPAAAKLLQVGGRAYAATESGAAAAARMRAMTQTVREFSGAKLEQMKEVFARVQMLGGDSSDLVLHLSRASAAIRAKFVELSSKMSDRVLSKLSGELKACAI